MDATVVKGGKLTFTITAKELSRGLRPSKRVPRNSDYLTKCVGMVGREGVLQALDSITRMDTDTITDAFPFPQIFIFSRMIIVCGLLKIYEWVSDSLVLMYTAAAPGGTWSAIESEDYVYMTNGKISVVRDPASLVYSLSTLPHATATCNYNGQVLIGAPDVDGLVADMMLSASPFIVTPNVIGII